MSFALIGASGVAFEHGRAIQRCRSARLAVVCSRDAGRADALAQRLGAEATTDLDALLRDPRIDAVDVVTEPGRHAEVGMAALERGKHLLVEKPIDEDLDAAVRLAELAQRSGLTASVVAPRRFDPALLELRRRLASGAIGRPVVARVTLRWRRDAAYYRRPPGWRARTGVLLNQAIHWLDALIWLFGMPEEVQALAARRLAGLECEDTAVVCARHPDGALSTLAATTVSPRTLPDECVVIGDQGTLDYRRLQQGAAHRRWMAGPRAALLARLTRREAAVSSLLAAQLDDFVESIRAQRPPRVLLGDGVRALEFVKRCDAATRRARADEAGG